MCIHMYIYIYMILELSYCSKGEREKAGKRKEVKRERWEKGKNAKKMEEGKRARGRGPGR